MRYSIWLIISIITLQNLNAQNYLEALKLKIDTTYIKSHKDKLALRCVTQNRSITKIFLNKETEQKLMLKPNGNLTTGVGLNWKWIGFEVLFNIWGSSDNTLKGKTKSLDVRLMLPIKSVVLEPYLINYSSYYISNPTDFDPNYWAHEVKYPILEQARTSNIGVTGYYIANAHKFNYKGVFIQNFQQLKSQGSWLLGAFIDHQTSNNSKKKLVDSLLLQNYPLVDFKNENNLALGLTGGYAYTHVFSNFVSLTGAFLPGIGSNRSEVGLKNKSLTITNPILMNKGFLALNYTTDKWFCGANLSFRHTTYLTKKELQVFNNFETVRFQFGYRF